jgi:hypothetical protein
VKAAATIGVSSDILTGLANKGGVRGFSKAVMDFKSQLEITISGYCDGSENGCGAKTR